MAGVLKEFFIKGSSKNFRAGEVILHGGEASGAKYIDEGYVKVYSISDDGSTYLHVIYKAGEIFPLIWVIKGIRRRVFYEALSDVRILEVPKDDFLNLINEDHEATLEVLNQLATQFYFYADRIDNLQYKSAYERVVYRLLFLAGRFGKINGNTISINAPLTHDLIAQSINLARESVSRQIEKLEKQGLLEHRKSKLVILDVEKLSREFSEPVSFDLWGLLNTQFN